MVDHALLSNTTHVLHVVFGCRHTGRAMQAMRRVSQRAPRVIHVHDSSHDDLMNTTDVRVHLHVLVLDLCDPASVERAYTDYRHRYTI